MRKSIVAVLTLAALVQAAPRATGQEESKSPCATEEAGQFDNGGLRLHHSGHFADGKMVLSGERIGKDGAPVTDRITWHANANGTVRQVWDTSTDKGVSWKTIFDGLYERE